MNCYRATERAWRVAMSGSMQMIIQICWNAGHPDLPGNLIILWERIVIISKTVGYRTHIQVSLYINFKTLFSFI